MKSRSNAALKRGLSGKNKGEDPLPAKGQNMYSLSRYFPSDTIYFYSFPAGEESGFFNSVPTWVEELVAGRPLLAAGENLKVLTFASVYNKNVISLLKEMGVPPIDPSRVIVIPKNVSADIVDDERNKMVKAFIENMDGKGKLLMAQPFLDKNLHDIYKIPPEISVWFNDKENLSEYIPAKNLPAEYAHFFNGEDFATSTKKYPLPCVVKVTSSGAGDGVRICHTEDDMQSSKEAFRALNGHVIVYKFINSVRNLCVQFGIPADPKKEIEIIGFNEQVIGKCGEFLGGMVTPDFDTPELQDLFVLMKDDILAKVRAKGWYGVGGLDVLITDKGEYYFIDPNFRMTATFVFVCQVRNQQIKKSLLGFTGQFKGTEADFRAKILPIAKLGTPEQILDIVALSCDNGVYRFNGALVFDKITPKEKVAKELLALGVESLTLTCICS